MQVRRAAAAERAATPGRHRAQQRAEHSRPPIHEHLQACHYQNTGAGKHDAPGVGAEEL